LLISPSFLLLNYSQFCDFLLIKRCKTYLGPILPPFDRNWQLIYPIVTTTNAPYINQLKIKMPHSYNWTVIIIDILYQNDNKMGSIGNPVIQQVKEVVSVSLEPRGHKMFVNLSNIMAEYPFKVCSLLPYFIENNVHFLQ